MATDSLSIASMRSAEEARAFELLNAAWISELFTLEPADLETLRDPFGAIVEPGGDVLIARSGDRIVGCAALVSNSRLSPAVALYESVGFRHVAPEEIRPMLRPGRRLHEARPLNDGRGCFRVR